MESSLLEFKEEIDILESIDAFFCIKTKNLVRIFFGKLDSSFLHFVFRNQFRAEISAYALLRFL
ncbi:hypothetical protein DLM78_10470 [Leptospira stimsonii]|uniref:Uncharacterized protein n=1 Tax=Leptospira stimsonii TaxID=2202203 RepID=A0A8B3CQH5_9LEPT|nr:hypothetical protein DLM78_10470 [Leptospira stimsonii]